MTKAETVSELIEQLETKLDLLKEWQECMAKAVALSDENKFEESDKIDDRCIEIEDYFEEEYGIKFDSSGDMYEWEDDIRT